MAPPRRVFRLLPGCAARAVVEEESPPVPPERRSDRWARRDRTTTSSAILVSVLFHVVLVVVGPALTLPTIGFFDPDRVLRPPAPVQVVRIREPEAPEPTPMPAETPGRPVLSIDLPAVTVADPGPPLRGPAFDPAPEVRPDLIMPPRPSAPTADVFVRPVALSILTNWRPEVPSPGIETTVRVHTDATGRATGLVELVPLTPNHRLNAEIAHRVRELEFQPATSGGQPIAGWAEITLVICPGAVTATSPASPSGLPNPCVRRVIAAATTGG